MIKRIVFVQYTDPASYPPVEHSTRILADQGWQVLLLGTGTFRPSSIALPEHPNVTVKTLGFQRPGWRQKVHYLRFCLHAWYAILRWRPQWVYASDAFACAAALPALWVPGVRLVYHEHDAPDTNAKHASIFIRITHRLRKWLASRADLVVVPNKARAALLPPECHPERVRVVLNCPRMAEVRRTASLPRSDRLKVLYHGSLVPGRLPTTLLEAMASLPSLITLTIVGFETAGGVGYMRKFVEQARRMGLADRVHYLGSVPTRAELFAIADSCDLGVAVMPMAPDDPNLATMAGASNKAFDYIACGLALLVSDLPDWRELYVETGCGLACDPSRTDSVTEALRWCLGNRPSVRQMGARGRDRVEDTWNYEAQFEPVAREIASLRP